MISHFCNFYLVCLKWCAKCFNFTSTSLLVLTLENLSFFSLPLKVQIQNYKLSTSDIRAFQKEVFLGHNL